MPDSVWQRLASEPRFGPSTAVGKLSETDWLGAMLPVSVTFVVSATPLSALSLLADAVNDGLYESAPQPVTESGWLSVCVPGLW